MSFAAMNRLEDQAKDAYGVYAYRTGALTAWEHLTPREQYAWKEVVVALDDGDHYCDVHNFPLTCAQCSQQDGELACLKCGASLLCPTCDVSGKDAAESSASAPVSNSGITSGGLG
jgi:hypothetical protein